MNSELEEQLNALISKIKNKEEFIYRSKINN
jgi:hypothetical protein